MGNGWEPKYEKAISPPMDQPNVNVFPDWAAMQAYYGPWVAIPQYFNSVVASDHAPHPLIMWGPAPPMMPPFGLPYGAIYAHGDIYAHTRLALAPTMDVETPNKSTCNTEQGLMKKKLEGSDGLAISAGNGNDSGDTGANRNDSHSSESDGSSVGSIGNTAGAPIMDVEIPTKSTCNTEQGLMKKKIEGSYGLAISAGNGNDSGDTGSSESDGSSDGSIGNTAGAQQKGKKRSREEIPTTNGDGNTETQKSEVLVGVEIGAVGGNVIKVEFGNPSSPIVQATTTAPQSCAIMASESWLKNEKDLKRERRKQSNRESARRSRLRKQAEAEELARRFDTLSSENANLKSEIICLTGKSKKLKLENVALIEQLTRGNTVGEDLEGHKRAPDSTENLLARVNNSGPSPDMSNVEVEIFKKKTKSGMKLRQLLDANPRGNTVAAS